MDCAAMCLAWWWQSWGRSMYRCWWKCLDSIDSSVAQSIPSSDRFFALRRANEMTKGIVCVRIRCNRIENRRGEKKKSINWLFRLCAVTLHVQSMGQSNATYRTKKRKKTLNGKKCAVCEYSWAYLSAWTSMRLVKSCSSTNAFNTCSLKSFFSPR